MTHNKINWDEDVWKHDINLKSYIRKHGNGSVNLNQYNHEQLLKLAKNTERANVLNDIEQQICMYCVTNIDNCTCERCDYCYNTKYECECDDNSKKSIKSDTQKQEPIEIIENAEPSKKTIIINYNNNVDSAKKMNDLANIDIEILSKKIRLKLFILEKSNKFKNQNLNNDIKSLIILIVVNHSIELQDIDKTSIITIFKKIEKLSKTLQLSILQNILLALNIN